ncbi:hypothetical protein HDU93_002344 [Gonapodya sp. JEL0774]|nr:hypothetical protein HDU93_002344 [Gonapodya sp. JEL0774]
MVGGHPTDAIVFDVPSKDSKPPSTEPFIVHIHFGMSGRWTELPSSSTTEALPSHRLELLNETEDLLLRVSGQVLDGGRIDFYEEWTKKLGEDPLRADADPERVWNKVQATKKPIGLILMDQSIIAGVGNIYRAEILYKSRLHPNQPSNTVPRDRFDEVWRHSVELLQRGFQTGSILTVDDDDARRLGPPPLLSSTDASISAPTVRPARVFHSHCARDDGETLLPEKMTVALLREELEKRGLAAGGKKTDMVRKLMEAMSGDGVREDEGKQEVVAASKQTGDSVAEIPKRAPTTRRKRSAAKDDSDGEDSSFGPDDEPQEFSTPSRKRVKSTRRPSSSRKATSGEPELFASAAEAAVEKEKAGEGRNVEHVSWVEEERPRRGERKRSGK